MDKTSESIWPSCVGPTGQPAPFSVELLKDSTTPTEQAFDWQDILQKIKKAYSPKLPEYLYLIVFRSKRRKNADNYALDFDDELVLQEAVLKSNAMLLYYRGQADKEGHCVSFCLWLDRDEARKASRGPHHKEAISRIKEWYSERPIVEHHLLNSRDGSLKPAGPSPRGEKTVV